MSCSDKLALWTVAGIQGSLLSVLMEPVYLDRLVIGEVASGGEGWKELLKGKVQSAVCSRLEGLKSAHPSLLLPASG